MGENFKHKIMENKDKKHNWFSVHGDIRVNKEMTTREFSDLLDNLGLEFLGVIGYSEFKDEDYE